MLWGKIYLPVALELVVPRVFVESSTASKYCHWGERERERERERIMYHVSIKQPALDVDLKEGHIY